MRKDEAQIARRPRGEPAEGDAAVVVKAQGAGSGPSDPVAGVPGARPTSRAGGSGGSGGLRTTVLRDLLTELTLRERLVLGLRYVDDLTVAEIAAVLEVAATEVERILDSVSERVRRRLTPTYGRPVPRLA